MRKHWRLIVLLMVVSFLVPNVVHGTGIVFDATAYNAFGYNTSGVFDEEEAYTCPDGLAGRTWLDPFQATYINAADSLWLDDAHSDPTTLYDTLQGEFADDWTFSEANVELAGKFQIYTYDAVGTAAAVGADFHAAYVPGGAEVLDIGGGTGANTNDGWHWVQLITTNHPLRDPGAGTHTGGSSYIDIPSNTQVNPYYDDGGAAGEGMTPGSVVVDSFHFVDAPRRVDTCFDHFWSAELYLVDQSTDAFGNRSFDVLGGVSWGWQNAVAPIPEPASIMLLGLGIGGLLLRRRKEST